MDQVSLAYPFLGVTLMMWSSSINTTIACQKVANYFWTIATVGIVLAPWQMLVFPWPTSISKSYDYFETSWVKQAKVEVLQKILTPIDLKFYGIGKLLPLIVKNFSWITKPFTISKDFGLWATKNIWDIKAKTGCGSNASTFGCLQIIPIAYRLEFNGFGSVGSSVGYCLFRAIFLMFYSGDWPSAFTMAHGVG